jgi:putative SOS response-associated peptidase YedK
MIERYSISASGEELAERFKGVEVTSSYTPRYNAAPSQLLPVITNEHPEGFSFFYWGAAPRWSRNKTISRKLINAEKEELSQKPTYKKALNTNRCLVPADGFYSWKSVGKKSRIPHRVILNQANPFAMAGLWEEYMDDTDQVIHTFSVITVPANDLVKPVNDRMPAILRENNEKAWLDPRSTTESLLEMLQPFPSDQMGIYTVSPMIDSHHLDSPNMVKPAPPVDQFGNFTLFN